MVSRANSSGSLLHSACAKILEITDIRYESEWRNSQVISMLGKKLRPDFWLPEVEGFEDSNGLYLQLKRQTVSGSADEKLPGLMFDIKESYDKPTLCVFVGTHLDNARKLFNDNADNKLIAAVTLCGFLEWCEKNSKLSPDEQKRRRKAVSFNPSQKRLFK